MYEGLEAMSLRHWNADEKSFVRGRLFRNVGNNFYYHPALAHGNFLDCSLLFELTSIFFSWKNCTLTIDDHQPEEYI